MPSTRCRSLSGNASRFPPGTTGTMARCAADALCGVASSRCSTSDGCAASELAQRRGDRSSPGLVSIAAYVSVDFSDTNKATLCAVGKRDRAFGFCRLAHIDPKILYPLASLQGMQLACHSGVVCLLVCPC